MTRMMNPGLVRAVTLFASICQVWFFLLPAMQGRWELSLNAVFDFLGSLLFASVAPVVVWVSALAISRTMAARRAERDRGNVGLAGITLSLQVPDIRSVGRVRPVNWLREAIPLEWAGAGVLAAVSLSLIVLLLLTGGALAALGILESAPFQGFQGPINLLAILFTIAPAGVVLAHVGGANILLDEVERAEGELAEAELALRAAKEEDAAVHAGIRAGLIRAKAERDTALATIRAEWTAAYGALTQEDQRLQHLKGTTVKQFKASSTRILAIARGLNDRLPLDCDLSKHAGLISNVVANAVDAIEGVFERAIQDVKKELEKPSPTHLAAEAVSPGPSA